MGQSWDGTGVSRAQTVGPRKLAATPASLQAPANPPQDPTPPSKRRPTVGRTIFPFFENSPIQTTYPVRHVHHAFVGNELQHAAVGAAPVAPVLHLRDGGTGLVRSTGTPRLSGTFAERYLVKMNG